MFTLLLFAFFFFNDTATTEIYTLSLHDALPIWFKLTQRLPVYPEFLPMVAARPGRSEEHTSELQSRQYLVCRLLLEKKKKDVQRATRVRDAPLSAQHGEAHASVRSPRYSVTDHQ